MPAFPLIQYQLNMREENDAGIRWKRVEAREIMSRPSTDFDFISFIILEHISLFFSY